MTKNIINVEVDEVLYQMGDLRGAKFKDTARVCLEKLMPKVCINSRHVKMEINVTLTDNVEIQKINKEHRNIDRPTDVLSFPLLNLFDGKGEITELDRNPETGAVMLGDIVISVDKIEEQASEYGHSATRETGFLVCHGLLHLLGYDHMEPEREAVMMPYTEKLLSEAGYVK